MRRMRRSETGAFSAVHSRLELCGVAALTSIADILPGRPVLPLAAGPVRGLFIAVIGWICVSFMGQPDNPKEQDSRRYEHK